MVKTKAEVQEYYRSQLAYYSNGYSESVNKIRKTSILRISSFLLTVFGIFLASNYSWITLTTVAFIGFSVFIFFVIRHTKLFKQKKWFETMRDINQSELDVLSGNTSSRPRGHEWLDQDHPFVADLDIFGDKSLFQLIDRSATMDGRKMLASVLLQPFEDIKVLIKRQKAISELSGKPQFRQYFRATGSIGLENNDSIDDLVGWVENDNTNYNSAFNRTMLIANPVIGIGVVVLIALNLLNINTFFLFLILPFSFLLPKLGSINRLHNGLSRKSELLAKYSGLLTLIEMENFESDILQEAKTTLISGQNAASSAINKLSKISTAFDYRLNLLVGIILNVFLLWDVLQSIRLEKWKVKNRNYIKNWFNTLSQIDELNSFAGFAFNHPRSIFPVFSVTPFLLKGTDIRHPFIPDNVTVGNEVEFTGQKQFHIITGANMAGKSTYLRTVGINLILGMTGSPVLATEFNFKPIKLYTGIKTNDSLQDGESYFFAELKRLETIIRKLEKGEALFIILDEILRGTNSKDKQKGSKALISQLLKLGASGMIATHDLTLGALAESFPNNIKNKRFEVEIVNNELSFDYKLKNGVSQNLNATFLMKKMGITI